MLGYIEGRLIACWDKSCIIAGGDGLGYEISLTSPGMASLPPVGGSCSLFLSMVTREDAQELYGFTSFEEKRAFEILTGISKVGARTALAILSVFQPEDLSQIAADGDYQRLTAVSGIGAKTAQHIFLELKYKMASLAKRGAPKKEAAPPSPRSDAVAALAGLGYAEEDAAAACQKILKEEPDMDLQSLIRGALKQLAKGRV